MSERQDAEGTFVVICGGGPTGALLSALLGRMGVPNVVLEKESEITTDPRGIALDEDGIRILQAIGMYDRVFTQIGHCQKMQFISGSGTNLTKNPLLTTDYTTSEGGTGHVGFIFHKQPMLEQAIRDAISICPTSDLRTRSTVRTIRDMVDHVEVEYEDEQGLLRKLRASYLVGADGKTGFVRKRFLEPKGIVMEQCGPIHYDEMWVALNWHITVPTPESHPEFPLWILGYTPEDVYDAFFPKDFRFMCNPKRPAVCGRFGLPSDRLWRFEFVVAPGEDADMMSSAEETQKIVYPYLTHAGSRYNIKEQVAFPLDCIEVLRSRPFRFSARSCNKWAENRVILAGDAAHVFPPFGGQGIASGFRDSIALAWRLALLRREPTANHHHILTAWYTERKQQLDRSLASTIQNGAYVNEDNFWLALFRDWSMWTKQLIPYWRREIEKGPRAEGMTRYTYVAGLPFILDLKGGILLPQVYSMDLVTGEIGFTDDAIFEATKKGLFGLLVLTDHEEDAHLALNEMTGLSKQSRGLVREEEATVLIQNMAAKVIKGKETRGRYTRIATGKEFVADSVLCRNRPDPAYYDPYRIQKELGKEARFVIVRPDRFVYAACVARSELNYAIGRLLRDLYIE